MASTNIRKKKAGYSYKYADLAQIHEYLEKEGFRYYQFVETDPANGNDYVYTVPIIDGKELPARRGCRVVQATLSGKSNPAQEQGSAITYARRYSLLMAFGLATEDDDAESLTKREPKAKADTHSGNRVLADTQIKAIKIEQERTGISDSVILRSVGKKSLDEFSQQDYVKVMDLFKKTPDKGGNK